MWLSALLSFLHLMALALGLASLFARGRALRALRTDPVAQKRVLAADNVWGVAALVWIATGLLRAFGGFEKGTAFYLASGMFWLKLTLFAAVFALETWPMMTFVRWRIQLAKGATPDTRHAGVFARLNDVELVGVVLIAAVATLMARGVGML